MRTLDESYVKDFTIHNPSTGVNTDADSLPTCNIYEDTTVAAILTPTVVKRGSLTGQYYINVNLTAANGFEIGKNYNIVVTAVVGSTTFNSVIDSFSIDVPQYPSGAVVADGGNTSSTFKTDRTEAVTDYWKDSLILFVSGSLKGQVKKVSAYNSTTKFITVGSAFTVAPSSTDIFILINR